MTKDLLDPGPSFSEASHHAVYAKAWAYRQQLLMKSDRDKAGGNWGTNCSKTVMEFNNIEFTVIIAIY